MGQRDAATEGGKQSNNFSLYNAQYQAVVYISRFSILLIYKSQSHYQSITGHKIPRLVIGNCNCEKAADVNSQEI
jgi:hypothetical protein